MPFQKQLKDVYVCLGCSLKSDKRFFSSSSIYNNSVPARQAYSNPFVNQIFEPAPASPPASRSAARGSDNNGSPFPTSPAAEAEPNSAEQRQSLKESKRIAITGPILDTQLASIVVLSKVTKKLAKVVKPKALVGTAVKRVIKKKNPVKEQECIEALSEAYSGRSIEDLWSDLAILQKLNRKNPVDASAEHLVGVLTRKGLLKAHPDSLWHRDPLPDQAAAKAPDHQQRLPSPQATASVKRKIRKISPRLLRRVRTDVKIPKKQTTAAAAAAPTFTSTLKASSLHISQLARVGPAIPNLCHDLSRVLFNPGIYELQDPRSRVYNFNPYLETIMPVSEFDFKFLKEYITSSRDGTLRSLAIQHGKKYVGSTSSMTSTLGQFHFLLSQWRELNVKFMSRGFSEAGKNFTVITRSPSSVFIRYQDGVYSMDADKEYDTGNILMSLGKSMEKLLTQTPEDYERFRKTSVVKVPEEERKAPEAYQYTHAGDFLMRAQLDAHDPRLPGTGTFDLKTRAVASIRHNITQHEEGFGYQIKQRFGDWESYEREYFDMVRSTFLKYSLQVRMGQMDGIFVAFHNVERIFGFQYVSLPEMDRALHGQYETTLGDQEFKLSVELLNQVLNRVTEKFPQRSLRLLFETRDLAAGGIFMQIFAEPMDESSIEAIQTAKKEAIDAFEQSLMNPEASPELEGTDRVEGRNEDPRNGTGADRASANPSGLSESRDAGEQSGKTKEIERLAGDDGSGHELQQTAATAQNGPRPEENKPKVELLTLRLRIQNRVNGKPVERPTDLTASDTWSLDYTLEEETRESSAHAQYRASKARRKTILAQRAEETGANYYLKRLRKMAISGAEWRKAQDELDAGRKKVVLYDDVR